MKLWHCLLLSLLLDKVIGIKKIEPFQVYVPSISGARSIKVTDFEGISYFLVFSGSTDVTSYSSSMMIYDGNAVQFSSTPDYPSDRSYYGMAYSSEYIEDYKLSNAIVFGGIGPYGVLGDFWQYYSDFDYWYKLGMYMPESAYDFAYAFHYDSVNNSTRIFILGGINNNNEYVQSSNEYEIEKENVKWLNDYTQCTTRGLAGAQLVYSENILYLFSGYSYSYQDDLYYFKDLCSLNLTDPDNSWNAHSIFNKLGSFVHGGSCLYDNKIYFIFGSNYGNSGIKYSSKIYILDLNDISEGWKDTGFTCPDGENCARDSFGYACDDDKVTIVGGKTIYGTTNSIFTISLDSLKVKTLISETSYPTPRSFASLTQSSTKLLLFGGMNKGKIFNDVWEFEYQSENMVGSWSSLAISGSSPEPRYGHAAAAQGIFTVFVGGMTYKNRILSEIWLLNSVTNSWTEITPSQSSKYKIPALTQTCAMLDLPKVYFIGGRSNSDSNFDLWVYDLSTNELLKLRKTQKTDTKTHAHACQLIKTENNTLIYTFYGLISDMSDLYCGIRKINITDTKKITVNIIKDKPDNMGCRGNFAFSYDGTSILIAGGEVYPDIAMNDLWWINFTDSYDEVTSSPLYEPLSGSSIVAFSDSIFLFSGFHDGSFSINSDVSSALYLTSFSRYENCGFGYHKNNDHCEPCGPGTYKPTSDGECELCPLGTTHNLNAATHISQCIPCEAGKYFGTNGSNQCEECPIGYLCHVGSSEPVNSTTIKKEQQYQPKIFVQPSMGYSLVILSSLLGFSVLVFIIIFFSALFLKVVFSVYDIYKAEHIIPQGETSYKEDKTKISFAGGFFTGLAIVIIIFNFAFFIINYNYKNEGEFRSLVPVISLVQDQDFKKNHLMLEVYMSSYREDCLMPPYFNSSFFNLTYAYFDEEYIGETTTACTHIIDIDFNKLFTTGTYIELFFSSYTSDISVTLSGKSGNPGAKSSYTQVITPTYGYVLKGTDPSVFTFSIMPAYYSYKGLFGQLSENIGFRVSSFVTPKMGSIKSRDKIYLATGFSVKVEFIMSESGMTTYRFHQIDPITLVILMLSSVPGLSELFMVFLKYFEKIYYLWKKIPTGIKGTTVKEHYQKLKHREIVPETERELTSINNKDEEEEMKGRGKEKAIEKKEEEEKGKEIDKEKKEEKEEEKGKEIVKEEEKKEEKWKDQDYIL